VVDCVIGPPHWSIWIIHDVGIQGAVRGVETIGKSSRFLYDVLSMRWVADVITPSWPCDELGTAP
jgi:hypothetical protein